MAIVGCCAAIPDVIYNIYLAMTAERDRVIDAVLVTMAINVIASVTHSFMWVTNNPLNFLAREQFDKFGVPTQFFNWEGLEDAIATWKRLGDFLLWSSTAILIFLLLVRYLPITRRSLRDKYHLYGVVYTWLPS